MSLFPSDTLKTLRAHFAQALPAVVTFQRDGEELEPQEVSFYQPRPRAGEEQAISPQGNILGIRGTTKLDVRQGDTFEYDGRRWEVVTVTVLTAHSVSRRAEAEARGLVVEEP